MSNSFTTPRTVSPPGSSVHGISPGKNTGVECHFLLQGNLPDPGMEPTSYALAAAAAAKLLQSCPTLCNPIDCSPPGSPVPEILQASTLEWVAISFPNAWKWKVKVKSLSRVWLLATPWTAAYQAPPSMGFLVAGPVQILLRPPSSLVTYCQIWTETSAWSSLSMALVFKGQASNLG